MTILLNGLLAVSLAWATPETSVPFEQPLNPPAADYPGNFDGPPAFHWSATLPGQRVNAASHTERSRPVIVGETLLVGAAGGAGLYRLSRRDGSILGHFAANASVESEPVVQDERVYFSDTGGTTWCYKLDGTELWHHDSGAPVLVRPTVSAGLVYVTNVNDLAVALRVDTGALEWQYQRKKDLTREAELALFAAPPAAVADDLVVLGFSDGAVVGLEGSSGTVRWERRVGEGRYPDIVAGAVATGTDIIASGYFKPVVAIDLTTQNIRWRMEHGAAAAVAVDEASGLIFHPGTDGRLRAIITLTGALKWSWASGTSGAMTTPVVTEAGILIGSSDGALYLIDPDSGVELWRFSENHLLEGITVAPVVDGRQVLFVTNAGRLYSMLVPTQRGQGDAFANFFRVGKSEAEATDTAN